MSIGQFESLLNLVGPTLSKPPTNFRGPIDPEQRLAVCLRFLSTGDSYPTIASSFHLDISTVAGIVAETCDAIWSCLKEEYMPVPTEDVWKNTTRRFQERWNFPNCLGAMDGKHIVIQAPAHSGSLYLNYKGKCSVVLLALVDADYRFLVIDVRCGSSTDGGIFSNSALGKSLRNRTLNIPPPAELPGASELGKVNHVIVADKAFPLKPYLLRPYPGRRLPSDMKIFNHRLSRACRLSENAFGILSHRFRVFQRRLLVSPTVADSVIKAACILCNFLRPSNQNLQEELLRDVEESSGCSALVQPLQLLGNHASIEARNLRDTYRTYFSSPPGQVDRQYEPVNNGLGGS